MNDKNKKLIFEPDDDMIAVVTLTDEDGNEFDAEIIAALEIEELGREFVAVMPPDDIPGFEENEATILEYSEDENGEAQFDIVEDEDIFDTVTQAFDTFFNEIDEEDDDDSLGYLGDIGDIVPGVSVNYHRP